MTQKEALEILHLEENASQQQIIDRYKEQFNEIHLLIDHAPDVYLKKQYQKKLVNIVHAYNFLIKDSGGGQMQVSEQEIAKLSDEKPEQKPVDEKNKSLPTQSAISDNKQVRQDAIFTHEKQKKKTKALIYTLAGLLGVIVLLSGIYFAFVYKSPSTIRKEIDDELLKLKNAKSKREADSLALVISIRKQLDSSKKVLADALKKELGDEKPNKKTQNQVRNDASYGDNIVVNIFNDSDIELQASPYSNGSIISKIYGKGSRSVAIPKENSVIYIWSCKLKGEDLDCEWKPYSLPSKGEKLNYEVEGNKFTISR